MSFSDASTDVGDDFITDNSDRAATGVRIQVVNNSTGSVKDVYTSDGVSPGYASLLLSGSADYKVRVLSEAEVNGNTIAVWNDDTHNQFYAHVRTTWRPGVVGNITIRTPVADQWNILAVSSWAMTRSNAGLSGKNFRFYTQECPTDHYNCIAVSGPEAGRVYICPSASTTCTKGAGEKYVIAHETGHQIAYRSNGKGYGVFR